MNYELLVAVSAIGISVISLVVSIFFSLQARKHDRKSVLPYPDLYKGDYEDDLLVELRNRGIGPMIVKSVTARYEERCGSLVDLMPDSPPGFHFVNFAHIEAERSVLPGEAIVLLDAEIDLDEPSEIAYRDELRRVLSGCSVDVEYTDVYRSKFSVYRSNCSWFGRHVECRERRDSE